MIKYVFVSLTIYKLYLCNNFRTGKREKKKKVTGQEN